MSEPRTNEEIAYAKLKEIMMAGDLPDGEFLSQRMLAEQVGTAVVTVRAALRMLENEGLIEYIPRWGARIPVDDEKTLRERYFMRETLEAAAIGLILQNQNPVHRIQLMERARAIDELAKATEREVRAIAQMHYDFHQLFAELSGNRLLMASLERISLRSLMMNNARYAWGGEHNPADHVALVEAIFSGDAVAADQAIREHVRRGLERELRSRRLHE